MIITMTMMTMMVVMTPSMMLMQLRMMNVQLLMIDDAFMATKFDNCRKQTDGQTQRLIGMRWTHPKTREVASKS